jgi:hypothetical protein
MSAVTDIIVSNGTRHWLPRAEEHLRVLNSDARIYVVVFRDSSGRIGFDLNEIGEKLFGDIIGSGHSWVPKENCPDHFEGGSPTDYVRSLFVRGLSTPITVRSFTGDPYSKELSVIDMISRIDSDEEQERFSNEIALFATKVGELCVHSVGQWVTTVIATHGDDFLKRLEERAAALDVRFSHVIDERLLPEW